MSVLDTLLVDSISSDLIKVEPMPRPVTLVMKGIGQLMGSRAETVPLCYLALVLVAGAFFIWNAHQSSKVSKRVNSSVALLRMLRTCW